MADENSQEAEEQSTDKPKENLIPEWRFKEATGKLKSELERNKQELEEIKQKLNAPKTEEKPIVSRETLRKAVDDGDISQEQADEFWDKQQERLLEKKFEDKLNKRISELESKTNHSTVVSTLSNEIDKYIDMVPDLNKESEARTKVANEYLRLAERLGTPKQGSAEDLKLQVLALETIYGSPSQLKSRIKETSRETLQEVGDPKPDPKASKLKLDQRARKHYERLIDRGIYKNWDAVEKELAFKRA